MQQNSKNELLKEDKKEVVKESTINKSSLNKKSKDKIEYEKLKQKYFDYYDDVKSHTHDVYDW